MTLALPLLLLLVDPTPTPVVWTWPTPPPRQLEGVTMTVRTDSSEYFQGERIQVHLTYRAETEPFLMSSPAYYEFEGFRGMKWHATRATDGLASVDPYAVFARKFARGGIFLSPELIRVGESRTQTLDLNEWLWFPEPGEYVLDVESFRAQPYESSETAGKFGEARLQSAPLKLAIRAATEADIQQVIARSRAVIERPLARRKTHFDPDATELRTDRQIAAAELRYLRDEAALPDYMALLNEGDLRFEGYMGLIGLPPEQSTLDALWGKVRNDPDFSIDWSTEWGIGQLMHSLGRECPVDEASQDAFLHEIDRIVERKHPSARFKTMLYLSDSIRNHELRMKCIALLPEFESDPNFAGWVQELRVGNDPELRTALKAIRSKLSESQAAIVDEELARRPD